jgi:hypothetical protein
LKATSLRRNPLVVVVRAHAAVHDFQVLDGGGASHIKEVVANTTVAGAATLSPAEVSEAVLYGDAFADTRAPGAGLGQLAESLL